MNLAAYRAARRTVTVGGRPILYPSRREAVWNRERWIAEAVISTPVGKERTVEHDARKWVIGNHDGDPFVAEVHTTRHGDTVRLWPVRLARRLVSRTLATGAIR